MATVREDLGEMKGDLKAIRETMDQAKGGWRLLVMVSGFSAAFGALIVKLAPLLGR